MIGALHRRGFGSREGAEARRGFGGEAAPAFPSEIEMKGAARRFALNPSCLRAFA